MNDREFMDVANLAELAHLPADDPRVIEAEKSPRTRALLATYRDFHSPGPAPAEARVAEADAVLAAVLERELALPAAAAAPSRFRQRTSWWARAFAPAQRPLWAFAGLVVIAAFAWVSLSTRGPAPDRVMRGAPAGGLEASVATLSAEGATFQWSAVPGADRYEVRLYASDLVSVLATHAIEGGTRWTMPVREWPDALANGEGVAWQVSAYRGEELLSESPVRTLARR